ncbi:MAG: SGNH/GDSL hydrolase family protein [Clostridia bacterium]|nr:SGNH/GDSL hydrolase family protein [Clostridia bacterium]
MELKGIKANFLGDSITEGHGTSDPATKTFHQLIAKKYGMAVARNYGISGTRFARQSKPSENPLSDLDFSSRYSEMDDDAQLVVLFGGTNDFGHGDAPLGSMDDRTSDTFYGACHTTMNGLINKYPDAKIVVMTPLHRISEDSTVKENGLECCKLEGYVSVIKDVAAFYSLPVLDLWSVSGLQPRVDVIRNRYVPDGLHPNDAGHEKMAEVIGNYLATI